MDYLKEIVLSVEAWVTGHPFDAAEAEWAESKFHPFTDFMVPKRAKLNLEINQVNKVI